MLKHVVTEPVAASTSLHSLLANLGLAPSSPDDLAATCEAVITKLPKEAERVRQGNDKVVMRLVGEVMKMSKGSADARRAREVLLEMLRK